MHEFVTPPHLLAPFLTPLLHPPTYPSLVSLARLYSKTPSHFPAQSNHKRYVLRFSLTRKLFYSALYNATFISSLQDRSR